VVVDVGVDVDVDVEMIGGCCCLSLNAVHGFVAAQESQMMLVRASAVHVH
jgi:hypothetical protein